MLTGVMSHGIIDIPHPLDQGDPAHQCDIIEDLHDPRLDAESNYDYLLGCNHEPHTPLVYILIICDSEMTASLSQLRTTSA